MYVRVEAMIDLDSRQLFLADGSQQDEGERSQRENSEWLRSGERHCIRFRRVCMLRVSFIIEMGTM